MDHTVTARIADVIREYDEGVDPVAAFSAACAVERALEQEFHLDATHRILHDSRALQQFIDWLPELRPHERYLLCLQGRKKYAPELKGADKESLKRVLTSKGNLRQKIQQMECRLGSYTTARGVPVPDSGMALYITPNPRALVRGTYSAIHAMLDDLQSLDDQKDPNPTSTVLTAVHRARSRCCFVDFDVDFPDDSVVAVHGEDGQGSLSTQHQLSRQACFERAVSVVGREAVTAIATRGGMHFLVRPEKVQCETRNWHPILCRELGVDQTGDLMVPVVGCNQGGFVPYFYTPETEHEQSSAAGSASDPAALPANQ